MSYPQLLKLNRHLVTPSVAAPAAEQLIWVSLSTFTWLTRRIFMLIMLVVMFYLPNLLRYDEARVYPPACSRNFVAHRIGNNN